MTVRATSIATYHRIEAEGLLSRKRFEIYSILARALEPMTANEIGEKMVGEHKAKGKNVHARLYELIRMGVVVEMGTRHCHETGNRVIIYETTDKMPVKFEKPLSELEKTKLQLAKALKVVECAQELMEARVKNSLDSMFTAYDRLGESLAEYHEEEHMI